MLSVLLCVRANYSQGCNLITGGDQTSVSWYQIRLVIFKFVSWYSNPSRGIQIRLVVLKSVSWYSNSSRGVQIRLRGIQIRLACKFNSLRLSCG